MHRLYELWGLTGWSNDTGLVGKKIHLKFPFQPLSNLTSMFLEVYKGPSNHTFFEWSYDVLKDFVYPKDELERAFVSSVQN